MHTKSIAKRIPTHQRRILAIIVAFVGAVELIHAANLLGKTSGRKIRVDARAHIRRFPARFSASRPRFSALFRAFLGSLEAFGDELASDVGRVASGRSLRRLNNFSPLHTARTHTQPFAYVHRHTRVCVCVVFYGFHARVGGFSISSGRLLSRGSTCLFSFDRCVVLR